MHLDMKCDGPLISKRELKRLFRETDETLRAEEDLLVNRTLGLGQHSFAENTLKLPAAFGETTATHEDNKT